MKARASRSVARVAWYCVVLIKKARWSLHVESSGPDVKPCLPPQVARAFQNSPESEAPSHPIPTPSHLSPPPLTAQCA